MNKIREIAKLITDQEEKDLCVLLVQIMSPYFNTNVLAAPEQRLITYIWLLKKVLE